MSKLIFLVLAFTLLSQSRSEIAKLRSNSRSRDRVLHFNGNYGKSMSQSSPIAFKESFVQQAGLGLLDCKADKKYQILLIVLGRSYAFFEEQRIAMFTNMIKQLKSQKADVSFAIITMTAVVNEVLTFEESKSLSNDQILDKIKGAIIYDAAMPFGTDDNALKAAYNIFEKTKSAHVHRRILMEKVIFSHSADDIAQIKVLAEKLHNLPNMGISVIWEGCEATFSEYDREALQHLTNCKKGKCDKVLWVKNDELKDHIPRKLSVLCGKYKYKNPQEYEDSSNDYIPIDDGKDTTDNEEFTDSNGGDSDADSSSGGKGGDIMREVSAYGLNTGLIILGATGGVVLLALIPLSYYLYKSR